MDLADIFPKDGQHRDLYCDECATSMDLTFSDFSENVSSIQVDIKGLPYLHCPKCDMLYLTDRSRFAIIDLHKRTFESGHKSVNVIRRKSEGDFNFTDIPFKIDHDDYHYIPGLQRPWDSGFLAPLFFKKLFS